MKHRPYVVDAENKKLYVKFRYTGIHTLIVFTDGLRVIIESPHSRKPTWLMEVQDVIAWHEKELRETKGEGGKQSVVDALREALVKFERGEIDLD